MIAPQLPSPDELEPYLRRLELDPGGVVLIAITTSEVENYASARWQFFDGAAKKRLRRALQGEKRRAKP